MASPILPGATLGILGGGQLGAMFAAAAVRMGYRVEAVVDEADCPAARVCGRTHVGDFADPEFLARAAAGLAAVTFEFENVPAAAGRALAAAVPVRPLPDVLHTTQDRGREKAFLSEHAFACAPHRIVTSLAELREAVRELGLPAVLKTAAFGYDGKGQAKIDVPADVDRAWAAVGAAPRGRACSRAGSISIARSPSWRPGGSTARWPPSPRPATPTCITCSMCRARRPGCRRAWAARRSTWRRGSSRRSVSWAWPASSSS
jgi:formate-dependent phosphoribosylglycinamide formyltransferase (GAR transformylase)